MAMVVAQKEIDYTIKPEAITPAVDTSSWPLLLKNYNNCMAATFSYYKTKLIITQYLFALVTLRLSPMAAHLSSGTSSRTLVPGS
jgi:hypothetical protein